jgi:predicted esterase
MKLRTLLRLALLVPSLLLPDLVLAEEEKISAPHQTFEVAAHTAHLYAAPQPAEGKPWLWYAPTINGVSLAGRRMYFEGLLKAGVSIAGFDLGEVRGGPGSSAQFTLFHDEMVRRGFDRRPVLLGQSRGGLMTLSWGFRNPEKVRAFVGIYPVCNLADWAMKNITVTLADYALTEEELRRDMSRYNPIDNLKPLLDHKVPMFVIHGDSDKAVPYDQNTRLLKERYEAGGGQITVKLIPGEGHAAVPAFFEDRDLLEFVLKVVGK